MAGWYASPAYQKSCLISPVVPSILWGSGFAALSVMQGARATPHLFATNCGLLYVYHALQCPLEALHGRRSLLHNVVAGGTLGAFGVQAGQIGIPLLSYEFFRRYPGITPPVAAFFVYGGIAGILGGALGDKPL
mmetsp:Transcript_53858/g.156521  ORF Transcript_53858/g.156521 Transcript_53858/m.156521 type:complete len:134 (+) Transcript_53858:51-452(+)